MNITQPNPDDEGFEIITPAVRAFAVPHDNDPAATGGNTEEPGSVRWRPRKRPRRTEQHSIVFDCETTTDHRQRLLFGVFRHYLDLPGDPTGTTCVAEGIFFADDLPNTDPDGYKRLVDYTKTRRDAATAKGFSRRVRLMSRSQFVEDMLFRIGVQARGSIVGFNLPFDLTRIAIHAGRARRRNQGGFSLQLFAHDDAENRYRPRITIRVIDAHRALIGFTRYKDAPQADHGRFIDLRTAAFAYTNQTGLSLERACGEFDVDFTKATPDHGVITDDYIDYCRADVAATAGLYRAIAAEHRTHPIDRPLASIFSAATLGKAYWEAMGIAPTRVRHPGFPDDVCGLGMEAFYGGRAETRIRKVEVPVVYVDFKAMYMTVNTLMGTWSILTADHLQLVDATADVKALLDDPELMQRCFDPNLWRHTQHTLVQVDPNGARFPVRARHRAHRDDYSVGFNPFRSNRAFLFPLGDVIAAKFLDGPDPIIKQAWRLEADGTAPNLTPLKLCGEIDFDPRTDDLFRVLVEQRHRARTNPKLSEQERARQDRFLKVLANSIGYGVLAQFDRPPAGADPRTVTVYAGDDTPYETTTGRPEHPGSYCLPPLAAAVTGAARLMLALLEKTVTDAGGTYAFCDTDSMTIVATAKGKRPKGLSEEIPVLSWDQVDEIIERFETLNPYDPAVAPGSILEIETENYTTTGRRRELRCYAISAKRYQLSTTNNEPVKSSEHGLGHLRNPTNGTSQEFAAQAWAYVRAPHRFQADWLALPAVSQITVSSPDAWDWFQQINHGLEYVEQVKPSNFVLVAYPDPLDPQAATGTHPVAPFDPNPDHWAKLAWVDRRTANPIRLRTTPLDGIRRAGMIRVLTYRDILDRYRQHPEATALAPDGGPVSADTSGLLGPRPVRCAGPVSFIGKEANDLHQRATGLGDGEHLNHYSPATCMFTDLVVPVLQTLTTAEITARSGIGRRTVQRAVARRCIPHPDAARALTAVAIAHARAVTAAKTTVDIEAVLVRYLTQQQP